MALGLGRIGDRKKPGRCFVDAYVGGLGGKQYRREQLERRAPVEFGGGVRVFRL